MSGMLRIGALWRGKEGGKASATGQVNLPAGVTLSIPDGQRLVLMANDKRENDRQPEWHLFLAGDDNESAPPSDDSSAL